MGWIRRRLLGGFGMVLIIMLGLGFMSFWNAKMMSDITNSINHQATVNTQLLQAELAHTDFMQAFYQMFLTGSLMTEPVGPHECVFGKWYDSFTPSPTMKDDFAKINDPHQAIHQYGKETWQLAARGDLIAAEELFVAKVMPTVTKLRNTLQQIEAQVEQEMQASINESHQATRQIMMVIIGAVIASFITAIVLALLTAQAIAGPIRNLVTVTEAAAQGDLNVEMADITGKGEIKILTNSFAAMISNLKALIIKILQKSDEASRASDGLAHSSDETRRAAEQIAITIQDIAEGGDLLSQQAEKLDEHTNQVKSVAQTLQTNATNNLKLAQNAEKMAEEGQEAVSEAITQLTFVTETVEFATDAIQKLGMRSGEIATIVEIIEALASQTNLLALNAAIEAARAGESGRGFAVVAEEVRKLAEESASAADKITSLIEDIQSETTVTVNSMEVNAEEISKQMEIIETAGYSLNSLVESANDTRISSEKLLELSNLLQQSGLGLESLVTTMGEAIIVNAAGSEEVAASAEEQTAAQDEVAAAAEKVRQITIELVEATRNFKV